METLPHTQARPADACHASNQPPETPIDPVADRLPRILRLTAIEHMADAQGQVWQRAKLFHECAALSVEWCARCADERLQKGVLVSIRWAGQVRSHGGYLRIARLVPLERAEADVNLFESVPPGWVRDRALVARATALWSALPRPLRHLFNATLWDGARFGRFVTGPSSLRDHHNGRNGNLLHSVEVAEQAMALARGQSLVNAGILVAAALVHDAGKADDYRYDDARQCFRLSDRGVLIGHRDTLQHWIAAAMAQHRVLLEEAQHLALVHALTAAKGAPAWLGLREPRSLEATILSVADRLSGEHELFARLAPAGSGGGFGRYHPHLKGRPYVARGSLSGALS